MGFNRVLDFASTIETNEGDRTNMIAFRAQRHTGFTLLELMIVIAILAVLGSLVVVNVLPNKDKADIQKAQTDIATISAALNMYRLDNNDYPDSNTGLIALTQASEGASNFQPGGYIQKLSKDPWGNDYQYLYPGENAEFDVYTLGRDGAPGGEGIDADIGNWSPATEQ